jgi:hypothetical protein
MDRRDGRLAWLYSVLSDLDAPRLAFALGPGANQLEALERAASSTAPEWKIDERPFWRPAFDFSLVLALVDVRNGGPRGSYGFWREVFGSTDLERWRGQQGDPLTSGTLIELLFEHPYTARERWDLFALGQRTPGVERNDPQAGLLLRGARLHPSLGLALDRVGVRDLALGVALHRASARVTARDEIGTRGELVVWQGVLAMLERASLTGGLDAASLRTAFEELAALKLDDPRAELTAWLMGRFVPSLAGRPGAPAETERALLETIGGALTPHGRRKHEAFSWEDLSYVIASNEASARVMSTVRGAQGPLTLDEAKLAWDISSGATEEAAPLADRLTASAIRDVALHGRRMQEALKERDVESLRREAARAAETITSLLLPAFAYSPHLAASEMPELGADIAFRHELGPHSDAASTKVLRPWQLARGHARDDSGWHLQGSLLGLEVAVSNWYLRRNGEPPTAAPVFDEPDVLAFALVPALLHLRGVEGLGLAEAAAAIDAGRRRASAASDLRALDDMLRDAGIDPWRRRALRVDGKTPAEVADELSATESWRLGGAPGRFAPRGPLDGCLCLGETTHSTFILEGRRSSGMIGAGAVDVQLRTAVFLRKHQLPEQLFGGVIAGALLQMIENTRAARPDDFQAIAAAVSSIEDTRMEEHLLALVGDGTLARPSSKDN